jgi:Predicted Fe-S oxidoreductases
MRLINLLGVYVGYAVSGVIRRPIVLSTPSFITIEPVCGCNLACPECPVGTGELWRQRGRMKAEMLKSILKSIAKRAIWANLYFQGEPLLNSNLPELVQILSARRVFTSMSTNGLLLTEELANNLMNSGLKEIIFSIDGSTEKEYLTYRRGGSIEGAWSAVATMVAVRKSKRAMFPRIVVQCLVTSANENGLVIVRQRALSMGADVVEFKTLHLHHGVDSLHLLPTIQQYSRYAEKRRKPCFNFPCFRLWSTAVLSWNGELALCCMDKEVEVLNTQLGSNLNVEWTADGFQLLRRDSINDRYGLPLCKSCDL